MASILNAKNSFLKVTSVLGQGSIVLLGGSCPTGTYGDTRNCCGPTVRWSKGGSVSSQLHRSDDEPNAVHERTRTKPVAKLRACANLGYCAFPQLTR
jgi:hypothetical protein